MLLLDFLRDVPDVALDQLDIPPFDFIQSEVVVEHLLVPRVGGVDGLLSGYLHLLARRQVVAVAEVEPIGQYLRQTRQITTTKHPPKKKYKTQRKKWISWVLPKKKPGRLDIIQLAQPAAKMQGTRKAARSPSIPETAQRAGTSASSCYDLQVVQVLCDRVLNGFVRSSVTLIVLMGE